MLGEMIPAKYIYTGWMFADKSEGEAPVDAMFSDVTLDECC